MSPYGCSPWWHGTHVVRPWRAGGKIELGVTQDGRREPRRPCSRLDPHVVLDPLQEFAAGEFHAVGEVFLVLEDGEELFGNSVEVVLVLEQHGDDADCTKVAGVVCPC